MNRPDTTRQRLSTRPTHTFALNAHAADAAVVLVGVMPVMRVTLPAVVVVLVILQHGEGVLNAWGEEAGKSRRPNAPGWPQSSGWHRGRQRRQGSGQASGAAAHVVAVFALLAVPVLMLVIVVMLMMVIMVVRVLLRHLWQTGWGVGGGGLWRRGVRGWGGGSIQDCAPQPRGSLRLRSGLRCSVGPLPPAGRGASITTHVHAIDFQEGPSPSGEYQG